LYLPKYRFGDEPDSGQQSDYVRCGGTLYQAGEVRRRFSEHLS